MTLLEDFTEFPTQLVRELAQETPTDGSTLQFLAAFPVFIAKCIKKDFNEALYLEPKEDESDDDAQTELSKAGGNGNLVEGLTLGITSFVDSFKKDEQKDGMGSEKDDLMALDFQTDEHDEHRKDEQVKSGTQIGEVNEPTQEHCIEEVYANDLEGKAGGD